jgi:predicted kinase
MKLILIRGLPGSGKSTLAKTLMFAPAMGVAIHREADQYFMDKNGEYNFDVTLLNRAHEWCQKITSLDLSTGCNVIVSNTFTTLKELKPYFEIADGYGITPQVITCHGCWANEHNVPIETMTKMKQRFVSDISSLYEKKDG